eukprot:Skav216677  [mRNA]  locus=scaffold91:5845:6405:+ [translate_table: standard]
MAMKLTVLASLCHLISAYQWRVVGLGPPVGDISNGTFLHVPFEFQLRNKRPPLILGLTLGGHDLALVATLGGEVLAILELERYHKVRYFDLRILAGLNKYFPDIPQTCAYLLEHRFLDCVSRLEEIQRLPEESSAEFKTRYETEKELILYENAMERCWALNGIFFFARRALKKSRTSKHHEAVQYI